MKRLHAISLLTLIPSLGLAQNRLINMTPNNRSAETNCDCEPTLAIDPNNYARLAGSAFTWDNLAGSTMTGSLAPIYVSTDRGNTWTLSFIVPSKVGGFCTGDIQLNFSSTLGGSGTDVSWLYGGILSTATSGLPMVVLRSQNAYSATPMTVLDTRSGNVDQPHVLSATSVFGGEDKLYVGFNNGWGGVIPNGRTATLDISQDAKVGAASFALNLIQHRDTGGQDGFAEVPAPHHDGTVYAAFYGNWNSSPRICVVRDDNWGIGASGFTILKDPSDTVAGRFVTPVLTLPSGNMGQQRLGASNISISVDPRNSDRVYLAYGDSGGSNLETIHVRRSTNRGQTWSGDLLTVTSAMNPHVAVNIEGTVGCLYQRVVSGRWETHFVQTTDPDATTFNTPGITMCNQSATTPSATYLVYIGDYASLFAAGKNFMGMFCASNYPDTANFMPGVQFNREVNWATHTLYTNASHTTTVAPSIDPYYFEIETTSPSNDVYVRDWTDDPTHGDNGAEPSTHGNFYSFSDVWNRRGPTAGTFVNDQPPNEDAGNGSGSTGDNWAFARIRRNTSGPVTNMTAHFLVSRFGTGSNYVDNTSADPNVTIDPDPVLTTDGTAGPWITDACHWHLEPTSGNHLCLAVEISSPSDPYVAPSLVGNTPGWGTGTDLRIISDNNKAQRNMHLTTDAPHGGFGLIGDWAIIHNAGLMRRDIPLQISVSGLSRRYVRSISYQVAGQREGRPITVKTGSSIVLKGMEPGENRWVRVNVQTNGVPKGTTAFVGVDELAAGQAASSFGVGVTAGTLEQAIRESLDTQQQELERLAAGFGGVKVPSQYFDGAAKNGATYLAFTKGKSLPLMASDLKKAGALTGADPFGLVAAITAAGKATTPETMIQAMATLMNGIDSRLTQMQLMNGDVADILQMVRWQRALFLRPALAKLDGVDKMQQACFEFIHARESGKITNKEYPKFLDSVREGLRRAIASSNAGVDVNALLSGNNLARLEAGHRRILLALAK
ncbi:MAG: hypothetical protein GC165_15805 [Armatimonadetes bacterium]|nr:hypothetical protein [Armatimonadota bacterium]